MKSIIFLFLFFPAVCSFAQTTTANSTDIGRIAISPYVSDQIENFPESAKGMLAGKFANILSANGLSGAGNSRFLLTANVVVMDKEITATSPPMHAYVLEVTLYIADAVERKAYSSVSLNLRGVDANENKAYINAIKNIKSTDPKIKAFIEEGKNKIIEFYNKDCDFIIKRAQAAADQNNFEEALSILSSVPEVSESCFNKAVNAIKPIYQKFIDQDCKKRLMEAKSAWAATQDFAGADRVAQILSGIDPKAACYREAEAFVSEVKKRIHEVDKREWDFTLQIQKDATDVEKGQLQSYRDILVAFGENQPQNITYNLKGWLW